MLVELNVVEQRYQAVLEVLHQGATVTDVARRNGVTSDGALVVAQVRVPGSGRVGGWFGEAVVVSASDDAGGRSAGGDGPPRASGVGSAHDPTSARQGRGLTVADVVVDLSLSGASPVDHPNSAQTEA